MLWTQKTLYHVSSLLTFEYDPKSPKGDDDDDDDDEVANDHDDDAVRVGHAATKLQPLPRWASLTGDYKKQKQVL